MTSTTDNGSMEKQNVFRNYTVKRGMSSDKICVLLGNNSYVLGLINLSDTVSDKISC